MTWAHVHARVRPSASDRSARQCAILLAVALHLFLAVWMLQRHDPPAPVASSSALVLVEMTDAARAATTGSRPEHASAHRVDGKSATRRVPPAGARRDPVASAAAFVPAAIVDGNRVADTASAVAHGGADGTTATAVGAGDGAGGSARRPHPSFLPPKVLRHWIGEYPESAFREHAEGSVELLVTVDADGRLAAAQVAASSGNKALDDAAIATVEHYLFKAGERDGFAERMDAYVEIHWTITPAVIRRFSPGEISLQLPMSLSAKRVKTRIGSYLETMKLDSEQNSTQ